MSASAMSPQLRENAAAVMDHLIQHPISRALHCPQSNSLAEALPTLETIRDRLSAGHYRSAHEWITDTESVIWGFEQAHNAALAAAIAREVRRLFDKERRLMATPTSADRALSLGALKQRLLRLNGRRPALLRAMRSHPEDRRPKRRFAVRGVSEHAIQAIQNDCQLLVRDEEILAVKRELSPEAVGLIAGGALRPATVTDATVTAIGAAVRGCLKRGKENSDRQRETPGGVRE
jgi:hypothetical protein